MRRARPCAPRARAPCRAAALRRCVLRAAAARCRVNQLAALFVACSAAQEGDDAPKPPPKPKGTKKDAAAAAADGDADGDGGAAEPKPRYKKARTAFFIFCAENRARLLEVRAWLRGWGSVLLPRVAVWKEKVTHNVYCVRVRGGTICRTPLQRLRALSALLRCR